MGKVEDVADYGKTDEKATEEKSETITPERSELFDLCKPVGQWLKKYHNPQTKVVIAIGSVEVTESVMGFGISGGE